MGEFVWEKRERRAQYGGRAKQPFYYGRVIAGAKAGAGACACVGGGTRPTTAPAMDEQVPAHRQPAEASPAQSTSYKSTTSLPASPSSPASPAQPAQPSDWCCCCWYQTSAAATTTSHTSRTRTPHSHPYLLYSYGAVCLTMLAGCCLLLSRYEYLRHVSGPPGFFLPSSFLLPFSPLCSACGAPLVGVLRTLRFVPTYTPLLVAWVVTWTGGATVTLPVSGFSRLPRQRATGVIARYCTGTCSAPAVSPRYSTKALYRDEFCSNRTVYMPRSELAPVRRLRLPSATLLAATCCPAPAQSFFK